MGKATQDLRKEHEAILYVLQILDKMMQSDSSGPEIMLRYYGEMVYFLKIFADKCHHGKEENYLFKELVNKGVPNEGGPVGAMLQEHAKGREYIAQMGRSLDNKDINGFNNAAVQYRDLLRQHIEKENNVLFMMARAGARFRTSSRIGRLLCRVRDERSSRRFGSGKANARWRSPTQRASTSIRFPGRISSRVSLRRELSISTFRETAI